MRIIYPWGLRLIFYKFQDVSGVCIQYYKKYNIFDSSLKKSRGDLFMYW